MKTSLFALLTAVCCALLVVLTGCGRSELDTEEFSADAAQLTLDAGPDSDAASGDGALSHDGADGTDGADGARADGPDGALADALVDTGRPDAPVDGGVTVVKIAVTPPLSTITVGTKAVLKATATLSNQTTSDVTAEVTWTSSAPKTATVSAGTVTAVAPGSTTITAALGSLTATASVTVSSASLVSIAVSPGSASTGIGGAVAFTATATLSDKTTQDVTASAGWKSSSPAVATVSAAGLATGIAAGKATVTASVGVVSGTATLTVTPATLISIAVTPTNPSYGAGQNVPFFATGTFSDKTIADLTAVAAWSSSDPSTAMVDATGEVATLAPGTSIIAAAVGSVSGTTTLTVTAATLTAIAIAPATVTVPVGGTAKLVATGTYSDKTTADVTASVVWSSSADSVATVSSAAGSDGLVTGLSAGGATITAALQGVSATAKVTVTAATLTGIAIKPADASTPKATTVAYTATGTYSDKSTADITTLVTWSIDNTAVATISNAAGTKGVASAIAEGTAKVMAVLKTVTGITTLTVTRAVLSAIDLSPAAPSLVVGIKQAMTATGRYTDGSTVDLTETAVWASSDTAVATVSNAPGARGQIAAVAAGTATITATVGSISGSTTVTVTAAGLAQVVVSPIVASRPLGQNVQYTAMAIFSNNTSQNVTGSAAWTSSNTAVATISSGGRNAGVATPVSGGTTTITATYQGISGSTTLTITAAPVLVSITVTPIAPTLAVGSTQAFTATAVMSDQTTQNVTGQATWVSSDTGVVGVTTGGRGGGRGRATAVSAGSATVSATYQGLTGSTTVTVKDLTIVSVSVSPASLTMSVGGSAQPLTAQAIYNDGSSRDVTTLATWVSSAPAVVGVTTGGGSRGLATAVAAGNATISATYSGVTGDASVTVTAAKVTSIVVDTATPTVAVGIPAKFVATAIFSDNTSQVVTGAATWTSSNTQVAAVSNAAGSRGLAQTLAAGTTTITATWNQVSGSKTLTVTSATITTIQVTPYAAKLPVGYTTSFFATAIFSDNSFQDVTPLATWTSSTPQVASVSDAAVTKGSVSPLAAGSATISAAYLGVTGTDAITVSGGTLTSIAVSPATASFTVGTAQAFTATGTFSDATVLDITSYVTWLSGNPAVVSVSNATNSHGQATAMSAGSATISALRGAVASPAVPVTVK
jgi:uncharacterized protein YjdB